jgi:hypothetical protein
MGGGLMQLVAYGAQDIYLTGNPQITYFKVVYRRHTNFAMEPIEQTFNGTVGFGNTVSATISRNGDLVSGMTLEVVLPQITGGGANDAAAWTNDVGHHLVETCTVSIGGQEIDKHYGDWLEIWAQLTVPCCHKRGYREMIGQDTDPYTGLPLLGGLQDRHDTASTKYGARLNADGVRVLYIPMQFWFCRNVGLALPLIALQYHEVKVDIKFRASADLMVEEGGTLSATVAALSTAKLWVDYIYLDTDERRRFAQVSHEYLIEQLQLEEGAAGTSTALTKTLNFNHPVKELVWVIRETLCIGSGVSQRSNYTNHLAVNTDGEDLTGELHTRPAPAAGDADAQNSVESAKLKLNGHDRFVVRNGDYFNLEQPYKHHTHCPESPGINVYSFALRPEEHQPSGTCNFSRIDNAQLVITRRTALAGTLFVFATNYNVLRIMSGMGGLAYSN